MEGINIALITEILTVVLTILSSIFGTKYKKYKKLLMLLSQSIDDDISKEDLKRINKVLKEL